MNEQKKYEFPVYIIFYFFNWSRNIYHWQYLYCFVAIFNLFTIKELKPIKKFCSKNFICLKNESTKSGYAKKGTAMTSTDTGIMYSVHTGLLLQWIALNNSSSSSNSGDGSSKGKKACYSGFSVHKDTQFYPWCCHIRTHCAWHHTFADVCTETLNMKSSKLFNVQRPDRTLNKNTLCAL